VASFEVGPTSLGVGATGIVLVVGIIAFCSGVIGVCVVLASACIVGAGACIGVPGSCVGLSSRGCFFCQAPVLVFWIGPWVCEIEITGDGGRAADGRVLREVR
jgi:hypothetical protein